MIVSVMMGQSGVYSQIGVSGSIVSVILQIMPSVHSLVKHLTIFVSAPHHEAIVKYATPTPAAPGCIVPCEKRWRIRSALYLERSDDAISPWRNSACFIEESILTCLISVSLETHRYLRPRAITLSTAWSECMMSSFGIS